MKTINVRVAFRADEVHDLHREAEFESMVNKFDRFVKIALSAIVIVNSLGAVKGNQQLAVFGVVDIGETVDGTVGDNRDKNMVI